MLTFLKRLKSPKEFFKSINSIFFWAVFLFWLKNYLVYQTQFELGVEGPMQQFLLAFNPISSALLILGMCFIFKNRKMYWALFIIDLAAAIWLYSNIVYYRFFNDFITVSAIFSTGGSGDNLLQSARELMYLTDIIFFFDVIIVLILILKDKIPVIKISRGKAFKRTMTAGIFLLVINLALAEMDRPQLLTRTFDRNYLVKYLGLYNFNVYDVITTGKSAYERATADESEVEEVEDYVTDHYAPPNPEYYGVAEGYNIVLISLESLQQFVIGYEVNGEEVTPFLNDLAMDDNTFYFTNFFHQTSQGKTSDSEWMIDTGLLPMAQGSAYAMKAQNTEQALPAILNQEKGYTSAVLHGNYKTFWNRNEMYRSMGYDYFFDAEYYDMSDENTMNYGLKDKPFFETSVAILEKLPQPFYAKMITLSNHFPFGMEEGDTDFQPAATGDPVVDQYFVSANYLDESLEQFFIDMKEAGLYENTIFVMYGDHYGISEAHNEAMAKVLGKETITPFDEVQLQRTVFMIHIPGVEGKQIDEYCGTVDIRQTILHLVGIDGSKYLELGTDMLSPDHDDLVVFRNGDFVTPEYTYTGGKFYDNATGEEIPKPENGDELIADAEQKLYLSDQVVQKDLLRFYTPEGFTPIDRNDYQYLKPTPEEIEYWTTPNP